MNRMRILVGEDNADHRRLLLMALVSGRSSVDLVVGSNRKEIVAAARRERFDCIVLDFNLPPDTAPEVLREIEPLQGEVPCIVISSSETQAVVVEALRTGVADFVPKEVALRGDGLWRRIEEAVAKAGEKRKERRQTNRRLRALQRLADTDPLTGVYNRRFVERVLGCEQRRGDRRRHTSVIMADLDHFKRVNDALGHAAGDRVLRGVAGVLKRLASGAAVVARWGGEEFVVLGQGDTEADAWIWADRVRRAIAAAISLEGSKDPLTASIGVVVVPTDEFGEAAISRADQAMYLAKESGRNRVCTWRMVTAIDAAHLAQMQASMTPRQRLRAVVDHLHGDLGRTQSEHLGVHGREVRELAMRVGRMMIKDRDELHDLEVAAEFHDIGKVGIPESLLALPRRLTEEERRFMDEHARFGAEVIRACGASERAARMVEEHHRRFDACAEHGEPISMGAMILGACDAVVTMQSRRPYGEPRTPTQALAELRAERGRQFDPDVVDTLQFVSHPAAA